ncbi:ATP-binding cassette domain-containing protein [Spirillospora sp. NPDC127200]
MSMGAHAPARRVAVGRAGILACAAAGPLAAGTALLLADALGGVVKMPGDAVVYTAVTALLLAALATPLVLWLARRTSMPGLTAAAGGLAAFAVAVAGLVPIVPVFASAVLLAGLLGAPLLALPRALAEPRLYVWWHTAALAGLAAAGYLAASFTGTPGRALVVAGTLAALLAVAAVCGPRTPRPPAGERPAVARLRDAWPVARPALVAYAATAMAVAVTLRGGLHLLLFRWDMVGSGPLALLAWAAVPAAALTVAARSLTLSTRPVPWLLLAAATAPVLVATAPASWLVPVAFTVALAAAVLAVAALDTAILKPAPVGLRPALAGLTAAVAVLGGLAGLGAPALFGALTDDASALTLTAVPIALAALAALGPPSPETDALSRGADPPTASDDASAPVLLDVRALSAGRGAATVRNVSLTVRAGEAVAVFGPGARTLLSAVAGRLAADRGSVVLGGVDVTAVPAEHRTGLGLVHLVHADTGNGSSVAESLHAHAVLLGKADPQGCVAAVLEVFPPLRERAHDPADALTGVERRLLALAEALITRPRLLVIDGLSPGLDPAAADVLAATVRRLSAEGTAVLLAEPSIPVALAVCDRTHLLRRGRTAAQLSSPTPEQVHGLLPRGGRTT